MAAWWPQRSRTPSPAPRPSAGSGSARARKAAAAAVHSKAHRCGGWALAGALFGGVAAAVVCAPARWLAQAVQLGSQGHVELVNATGTVWQGEAALVLSGGQGARDRLTLPTRVQWRWGWQQGPRLALSSSCCTTQPVAVRVGVDGVQLPTGQLQLPLAVLQGLGAPWNTLGVRGVLALQWQDLRWARMAASGAWALQGGLEVQARSVSTTLSTLPDVGSYRLRVSTGAQPSVELDTLRGALVLTGQGQWQGGKFRFRGEGRAQPEQAAALANLLTLLGNKQGNTTKIRWG